MFNEHDEYAALRERLGSLQQRIDATVERLAEAKGDLTPDGLDGTDTPTGPWYADDLGSSGDDRDELAELCGRLDAALVDTTRLTDELARRLRQLGEGAALEWPPRVPQQAHPGGGSGDLAA